MIKKIFLSIILLALLIMPLQRGASVKAVEQIKNLVQNASFEEIDPISGDPSNWLRGGWGENVSSLSLVAGHAGEYCGQVSISQYASGDIKWYFEPVEITTGEDYFFSDYYKSDVQSEVVAYFLDGAGNPSYQYVGSLNANSLWQKANFNLEIPDSTVKASIFHLINSVGYLAVDDYLFRPISITPPTIVDNVPNNSLEQVSPLDENMPLAWQKNSWGENSASFSYQAMGHSGEKSAEIKMASHTSGDAKWYFDPIVVSPKEKYSFSDFYRSDVITEIVVEYQSADGIFSYEWLGNLDPSADWSKASFNFTVPNNVVNLTVFHLIAQIGFLDTDDYSLADQIEPIITDNVPNNSFEQNFPLDKNMPLAWFRDSWGNNASSFYYFNEGHSGNKSAKVEITAYTDGDAKWYFEPQSFKGGETYLFSDYYKSNITSRIVLMITKTDGSILYQELKNTPSSSEWAEYSDVFTTPLDTATVSVFHLIAGIGFLITDDYSITPYQPTGFDKPILSLTFDDGWEDNYFTALPILDQYGFKSTQYYATTYIENNLPEQYKISAFVNDGHEIGAHSVTHPDLTTLSDGKLDYELSHSKSILESFAGAGNVNSFATPYGAYDSRVITAILKYFCSHRSTDAGFNIRDGITIANVRVQNMLKTTTLAEFDSWIDQAVRDNSWLVLVYHRVADDPGEYDTKTPDFSSQMEEIKKSGIDVKTVRDALSYLLPQTH